MRRISIDIGTIWVCRCCMLQHANGECCADGQHGGDGIAPWSAIDFSRFRVWMGLARGEHDDACDPDDECDCEVRGYTASRCDGCGSFLHGERHTFWLTRERQSFIRPLLPA